MDNFGGECLLVDYQHSQYLGGLPAVALPGGDLAAKQPWRNWLAPPASICATVARNTHKNLH